MAHQPVVAVVNTNPALLDLLKRQIEGAGLVAFVFQVSDIRDVPDVECIAAPHTPDVIVYDLVVPFDQNWREDDRDEIDGIVRAIREAVRGRPTPAGATCASLP